MGQEQRALPATWAPGNPEQGPTVWPMVADACGCAIPVKVPMSRGLLLPARVRVCETGFDVRPTEGGRYKVYVSLADGNRPPRTSAAHLASASPAKVSRSAYWRTKRGTRGPAMPTMS